MISPPPQHARELKRVLLNHFNVKRQTKRRERETYFKCLDYTYFYFDYFMNKAFTNFTRKVRQSILKLFRPSQNLTEVDL